MAALKLIKVNFRLPPSHAEMAAVRLITFHSKLVFLGRPNMAALKLNQPNFKLTAYSHAEMAAMGLITFSSKMVLHGRLVHLVEAWRSMLPRPALFAS
eukprot:380971-Karenia_brevis.AAC.1